MENASPGARPANTPLHPRTRRELWRLNKAAVKRGDYAAALPIWKAVAPPSTEQVSPEKGQVTWIGPRSMRGWLTPAWRGEQVALTLNGREVYAASACQPIIVEGRPLNSGFRLPVRRLWRHLGRGDAVGVRGPDGKALPLENLGPALIPWLRRPSRAPKLFERLDAGWVFNKWGKLQLPLHLDAPRLDAVMATFEALRAELAATFRLKVFIFYGTLLGCVRQGNFIPHDDDVDVAYISDQGEPGAVRAEFMAVCRRMAALGWGVRPKPFGAKLWRPGAKRSLSVGLHYGWRNADGTLGVAYGHHGPPCPIAEAPAFRTARIGAYDVEIPECAEAVLEMLYTSTWRVPDAGFSHHVRQRQVPVRFHLTDDDMASLSADIAH